MSKGSPRTELVDKFMKALDGQELSPGLHNSTLLQVSKWNTEKYFDKHYKDKTPYPLLITVKRKEGVIYIPATKAKKVSEEVFVDYWENEASLKERMRGYKAQKKIVDNIYREITSPGFVEKEDFPHLRERVMDMREAAWEMNTSAFFSIYFDQEMCAKLLKVVGSKISQKRLDTIWEKGTMPIADSFVSRRENYVLTLLEKNKSWKEIAHLCQYFGANYNKVTSIAEVEKRLRRDFGKYEDGVQRKKYIKNKTTEKDKRISEHGKWVETLSAEEKKLVYYLQLIMELRDERKDPIAQFLTATFRVTQKMFKEVGLDEELIYFCLFDELMQGREFLIENQKELIKRQDGCSVFIHYDGTVEIDDSTFEKVKSQMEEILLAQQATGSKSEIIKGQVGSRGNVRGTVKVVTNIDKESAAFTQGDILVTGMTRPEFVPLMKKASAIITDEGGITCHAAIVSRELGIPCIIGTKIATQVLKDGDLVEVDADNGVVKIIKD